MTRFVCKHHGCELIRRAMANGRERLYCEKCKKFMFNREIVKLNEQIFDILQHLNHMDEHLGQIWEIAFHHPIYEKMRVGVPEYGLSEVFVVLHECQRKILRWHTTTQVFDHE